MPEPIHAIAPLAAFVPLAADIPPGVDVDSIVAAVEATGVSAPASVEDGLLDAVQRAEDNGIDLSIVVVEQNASHDSQLRDLATAVGAQDGGTVLVLSPGQVGSFSDSVSRVVLEAGQDRTYTGDPVVAADNFVDTLTGDQTPWALMTGVIVVVVAGAAAATAVAKVRRHTSVEQRPTVDR
ncbi:hypothetical protein HQ346_01380 [Rhodococcus sp. BP-252]|uniref:Rv1476 family membrane protein n=1 Tax=unclassified Rhodococcus (in: high G+C Gram-positive bacteria) TaxID=192944 RepID=UPI001C9BB264|nr:MULTISPECIES: DUF6676 family protein [unclassified Rhodococcus (in: high G+C Gram-positive bacteria)]MBY6410012.1 hypothetical protein [Rhodococcus sp. BP-320]MBY6414981.1 hypothetical protein [Rhodococcus sp. BP-321]MBY6421316.1 hypothetical protein [Rhodococcus sp. BP-324]MBY6425711.1 hypothetical protein [Rhodococcus sp. BP-323]MBY6429877.1 hypothetical protein [Rhodococcus sp. BP-322]